MKTISKILSVVLCLTMVIGLFTVGASAADTYVKVTDGNLTSGEYVIVCSNGVAVNTISDGSSPWLTTAAPTISGDTVTDAKGAVWTLTVNGDKVTLTDANGKTIAPKGGNSNGIKAADYEWSYSFADGMFTFSGNDADTVRLASNTDPQYENKFRAYKNTTADGDPEKYPSTFTLYKKSGSGSVTPPPAETEPSTPVETPTAALPPVTNPVPGTTYKFGMEQVKNGHTVYIAGGINQDRYLETTTDKSAALDVTVEASGDGYKFAVTISGAKQYITLGLNSAEKIALSYTAEGTVFKFNATISAWVSNFDGTDYYIGSYNNFDTMSASKTSFISADNAGISQFPAGFYATEGGSVTPPPAETEPSETPTEKPTEKPSTGLNVVGAPVAGTAYKFGMIQQNVSSTDVYYLTGAMNGYYMDTTTDASASIDVYLEATEGGYYLYTNINGAKTYINMVVSGTHVNGAYEAAASTVYRYDADAKTLIADVDGKDYWFGTRNDKDFTTVGPCATSYNGFYCQFYGESSSAAPTGDASIISVAAAALVLSVLGGTALIIKKKEN